jgi:hypothetical protein
MNPGASFDRYKTFSVAPAERPPNDYQSSWATPEVRRRVVPLVTAALTARGYLPASGEGDFVVVCGSGRRTVHPGELDYATNAWLPDDEDTDLVVGALVIDAFDAATGVRIWHGADQVKIDPDRIDEGRLERSVAEIFALFPRAGQGR